MMNNVHIFEPIFFSVVVKNMPDNVKHALIAILLIVGLVTFTVVLVASHKPSSKLTSVHSRELSKNLHQSSSIRDSIVAFAKTLIGTPYVYASSSPEGFDCSGFVYYVYRHFDIDVSRSSATIAQKGKIVDSADARKADILIFTGTNLNDPTPGHVGIIVSENGEPIQFIHASSGSNKNGVIVTNLSQGNYLQRLIKIIRVL